MKIYTKVVISMETGETLYEESYDYHGEIAHCGGGDSGGGDSTTTVRYAPYVESYHSSFLSAMASYRSSLTGSSPFSGFSAITVDAAFFGTGYLISSFPSLYDMYGKFMAGLDIDSLYDQIFEDTVNASEVNNLVSAEADLLDDDIEQNILPRFQVGMRDINAVVSSSFVVGKSLIESARVKAITKFSGELKFRLLAVAAERWKSHLDWNKAVVMSYAELMKLYYSTKLDVDDYNYSMSAKNSLWPFTVLEYERAGLGALQGATTTSSDVAGSSKTQKALSGALAGASIGASFGGVGALVGGGIGLAASLF